MVTLLRPHSAVRCPKLSEEDLAEGYLVSVEYCKTCDDKEEIRQPWHGYWLDVSWKESQTTGRWSIVESP